MHIKGTANRRWLPACGSPRGTYRGSCQQTMTTYAKILYKLLGTHKLFFYINFAWNGTLKGDPPKKKKKRVEAYNC
jgi:hypothetical protein